jgi:hypothetical protein
MSSAGRATRNPWLMTATGGPRIDWQAERDRIDLAAVATRMLGAAASGGGGCGGIAPSVHMRTITLRSASTRASPGGGATGAASMATRPPWSWSSPA